MPASRIEKLGVPAFPLREQAIPRPTVTSRTALFAGDDSETERELLQAMSTTHERHAIDERKSTMTPVRWETAKGVCFANRQATPLRLWLFRLRTFRGRRFVTAYESSAYTQPGTQRCAALFFRA